MKLTSCRIRSRVEGSMGISQQGWLITFPYDDAFLEMFKDAIDSAYREWRPAIKSWWVDEDCAPVLEALFENWGIAPAIPQKKPAKTKPICLKCNGTGLLPFVKNGRIIPYSFSFCSCHPVYGDNPEPEHYHRTRPDDFDFPISYSFHRQLCQERGWGDPGADTPLEAEPPKLPEQVIVHRHSDMSKQDYDLIQQTARRMNYLEKKLAGKRKEDNYEPF